MAWAPDYATTDELAAYVRVRDNYDEVQMAGALTAASRAVDQFCGRQFGVLDEPEPRYYTPYWDRQNQRWTADIDDLMDVSGLVVAVAGGDEIDAENIYLAPRNAPATGEPYTLLHVIGASAEPSVYPPGEYLVMARWGWTASPGAVKTATLMQASRFLIRRDSPYGVSGAFGMPAGAGQGAALYVRHQADPDVESILQPYRKQWLIA